MKTLDIAQLDQAYTRLTRYLAGCRLPVARALAISAFSVELPPRFVGRAYYAAELGPLLEDAIRSPAFRAPDPDVDSAIRSGAAALGILIAFDGPADPPAENPAEMASNAEPDRVTIRVPVYQPIPGGGPDTVPAGAAALATLLVLPRPPEAGTPAIRWVDPFVKPVELGLRGLDEVGRDALAATRAALPERAGSQGGTSTKRSTIMQTLSRRRPPPSLSFTCAVDGMDIPVLGDSAGLALAVAMAGALRGAGRGRQGLRPRTDLAWTGQVLPSGEIAGVSPDSLPAKVRLAYFENLAGIVVPECQRAEAEAAVPALERPFRVMGAGHLRELMEMEACFLPWTLPERVVRRPMREHRLPLTAVGLMGAVLLLALFAAGLSWKTGSRRGASCRILEDTHAVLVSYAGGARARVHREVNTVVFAGIADAVPGDPARLPRLVLVTSAGAGRPGCASVRDPKTLQLLWSHPFETIDLPIDLRREHPEVVYNGKAALVADLDHDQDQEIVVSVSAHPFATTFLVLFDDASEPAGAVMHPGHVESLTAADLDEDGRLEVLAPAFHNPSRGVSLLVLRPDQFVSAAEGRPAWNAERQPCLAHFVFPIVPHLAEEMGVLSMGPPAILCEVLYARGQAPALRLSPGIAQESPAGSDYLVSFRLPHTLLSLVSNAKFVERAGQWKKEGRTALDFSSEEVLSEWKRAFRVYGYVSFASGPVTGDGGVRLLEDVAPADTHAIASVRSIRTRRR